jgi:hypothetical protein
MRLTTHFIVQRRDGRWYRGGEMVADGWSYSMLLFRGEGSKGSTHFGRGKENVRRLLVPTRRGDQRMQKLSGVR